MLKILIKDLKLFGYHGVREKEKKNGQDFLFNIKVLLNKDDFTGEDDLEKTLSYSEIIKLVKRINESRRFDLLETLSQVLAEEILKFSPLAEIVKIRVEKISPPIKEDLYSVGVVYKLKRTKKATKEMPGRTGKYTTPLYLSLGSNLGDRKKNLQKGVDLINKNPLIDISAVSSVYESEPMYVKDQRLFYNIVIHAMVTEGLDPFELLGFLKSKEYAAGRRINSGINGPRILDIDILYHGDLKIKSDFLTIPHPRLKERNFVLVPLSEVSQEIKIGGRSISEYLKGKKFKEKVSLIKNSRINI